LTVIACARISVQAFDHGLCRPCLKSAGAKRAPGSAAGNALPDDPTEAWQGLRVKQRCEALDTAKFVQAGPKPAGHVRFVVISDTHDHHFCEQQGHRHPAPTIPEGDVLIHAGDFTSTGKEHEVAQFNAWLGSLPHKHKIVIAGNHDLTFDLDSYPQLCQRFHYGRMLDAPRIKGATFPRIHMHITHTHTYEYIQTHTHARAHTHTYIHAHTHTHIHIHTFMHITYTYTLTHAHAHTIIHMTHTHARTYSHKQPPSPIAPTLKMRSMR
jgi:hypothetical protein